MTSKNGKANIGDIVCQRGKPSIVGYIHNLYEKAPISIFSSPTTKFQVYWIKKEASSLHVREDFDVIGKAQPEQIKMWSKVISSRKWDLREQEFGALLQELYPFTRE